MQEYIDGGFGDIEPAMELLNRLVGAGIPADLKALHFGTVDALPLVKKEVQTRIDLQSLSAKVSELESRINEATIDTDKGGIRIYPSTSLNAIGDRC